MTIRRLARALTVVALATIAGVAGLHAAMQPTRGAVPGPGPAGPTSPTAAGEQTSQPELPRLDEQIFRYWGQVIRVGQDYHLPRGARVGDVFVAFGTVRIEGRVDGDLIVAFGDVTLSGTAEVDGSLGVFGGTARADSGARVRRDVVTIGTTLITAGDFQFNGEHVVIGTGVLGEWMRGVLPWFTYGLLWGRPIVASLPWVWTIVAFFFVVYLLIAAVAPQPVRAASEVISRRPFGALLAGLLVLLLWAPIVALLAVSVVGIIVIPFFLCALVLATVVGRVSVMRWIGDTVVTPSDPDSRALGLRSFVIGFALLTVAYLLPVLGFVVWGLVGVFGLGAATLAFLGAWRTESAPPAAPAAPVAPSVAPETAPDVFVAPAPLPPPPPSAPPAPPAPSGTPAFASFLERAAAFLLDVLLIGIVVEVLEGWMFYRVYDDGFPLLGLAYFIVMWAWKAQTIGGMIMKLRVVKTNGRPLEAPDAIVRGLAGVLSFAALGIGVLWILRDPEHQGWHDKAVGTWVVKDGEVAR